MEPWKVKQSRENISQMKKRLPTLHSTVTLPPLSYLTRSINGQVSEWSNEHAWKVCVLATVPRVRIPPCPPSIFRRNVFVMSILRFLFVEVWGKLWENELFRDNKLIMTEENKTRDVIDAVTGLAQAVPVYEDLAQPAVKELSKGLLVVAKAVNTALIPVSGLVWGFEKKLKILSIQKLRKN